MQFNLTIMPSRRQRKCEILCTEQMSLWWRVAKYFTSWKLKSFRNFLKLHAVWWQWRTSMFIVYLCYSFTPLKSVVYCLCMVLDILSKSKPFAFSDNLDADSAFENSLYAKEKIISELNVELHKLENTLSNEREEHINEIKKLNSLLNEKVYSLIIR